MKKFIFSLLGLVSLHFSLFGAIVFNSPQDPYGIVNFGNKLGDALHQNGLQRGQERRQQARQKQLIQEENKKKNNLKKITPFLKNPNKENIYLFFEKAIELGIFNEAVEYFTVLKNSGALKTE